MGMQACDDVGSTVYLALGVWSITNDFAAIEGACQERYVEYRDLKCLNEPRVVIWSVVELRRRVVLEVSYVSTEKCVTRWSQDL